MERVVWREWSGDSGVEWRVTYQPFYKFNGRVKIVELQDCSGESGEERVEWRELGGESGVARL